MIPETLHLKLQNKIKRFDSDRQKTIHTSAFWFFSWGEHCPRGARQDLREGEEGHDVSDNRKQKCSSNYF
jgi:hypothetical protein